MGYWDFNWGLYRGYYRDPFPHSLLSTRQTFDPKSDSQCCLDPCFETRLLIGTVNPKKEYPNDPTWTL